MEVIRQMLNYKDVTPLPELTLDIDNGLPPDISVFYKDQV